jgi:hypothetical protein
MMDHPGLYSEGSDVCPSAGLSYFRDLLQFSDINPTK